jgi:LPS export ABC transporter protein LptC
MKGAVITFGMVALGIALWQSFAPESSPVQEIDLEEEHLIASYLLEGTRRHFSQDGVTADVLEIGEATRWRNSEETTLRDIRYQAQAESGAVWDIDAAAGIFYEDINELELKNGVTVLELTRDATMRTESMRLYMDQKRAQGEQEVVMTGRGSRTTGLAFELDLQSSMATLKGDVRTEYE